MLGVIRLIDILSFEVFANAVKSSHSPSNYSIKFIHVRFISRDVAFSFTLAPIVCLTCFCIGPPQHHQQHHLVSHHYNYLN